MRQSNQQGSVHIAWDTTPASPAQLVAWRWLWTRLLGHADPGPETRRPQEVPPGAVTVATVTSGRHHVSEHPDDTTHTPSRR